MSMAHVETYGMEPVPARLKTVRWQDLFCIIINFQLNAGQILVGGLSVAAGLPVWQAILAQTLGISLAFVPYLLMATVGVDHGIPGQAATRMAFGRRGARVLPSLLRTIASTYWFAFQTIAGSLAITAVLDRWTHSTHSLLAISLIFGALQALVAIVGYGSLKILSRVAHPDPHFAPSAVFSFIGRGGGWLLFVTWLNSWVATWLTMITDAADFCRYSRSRRDMWIGTMLAAFLGALFVSLLGAYAAGASLGLQPNAFALVAAISNGWLPLCLLLVVIVFDNWTINVLNLYTGGMSLLNMFERLGRMRATILVSLVGIGLSALPTFVDRYTGWINLLGTVFAPMAGVLLADYIVIKRMRLDVPALFTHGGGAYWYWRGFNPIAIAWTLLGFLLYLLIIPPAWPVPVVVLLLTGAGYSLATWSIARISPSLARAARPAALAQAADVT
jgi:purine-cytosine permease-like protein